MAKRNSGELKTLPLLPLRDVVVYPGMVVPLFVGRDDSVLALDAAMEADKMLFLVAQESADVESPGPDDLYDYGVVATILQSLRLPDGTVKVLIEGTHRARVIDIMHNKRYFEAHVELRDAGEVAEKMISRIDSLMRRVRAQFEDFVKHSKKIPTEVLVTLKGIEAPGPLADAIAAHLTVNIKDRQALLSEEGIEKRLTLLLALITTELELGEMDQQIQEQLKQQIEESQRRYYLEQKVKVIQDELGKLEEDGIPVDELKQLEYRIKKAGMSEEAEKKALSEWEKLKMMPPMSAEATVSRNYLDWLLDFPWQARSDISKDLKKSEAILEEDHYGLEKVKERILEYLAVQQRVDKLKGPILCLVGPPGVGKTSLGQSIANATGREFVRVALGGVRDEAEIRGHRRTYIGAMPGKIVQRMCKVKVKNPLFMLDEVDKMAMDFRGDPASALLEVLDPEQNHLFNDHYLEVDCDLSDAMFIATANSLDIPHALMDRMEVIRLAGYTSTEKLHIAKKYLLPRQIEQNGLKKSEIKMSDSALREIIRSYTREAGVRNLEREIAKICRKVVKQILDNKKKRSVSVTQRNIEDYLGVKRYRMDAVDKKNQIGQVTGLAWTEVGGELLTIEVQVMPGKEGKFIQTGSLGDVMQESISAAMTVVRSRSVALGIKLPQFLESDFHVHVPEGATPKDGPSAGVGMCTALVSALTRIPVRSDVAMTGEITLRGEVLAIGGLKEKLLAALAGGIKTVIIPEENARDLKELPAEVLDGLSIHPVRWIDEVLSLALVREPEPLLPDVIKKAKKAKRKHTRADQKH